MVSLEISMVGIYFFCGGGGAVLLEKGLNYQQQQRLVISKYTEDSKAVCLTDLL